MTVHTSSTVPFLDCQVAFLSSNRVHIRMSIDFVFETESVEQQLDSVVDRMSAQMMNATRRDIGTTLEAVDRLNVDNLQKLEPD